MRDEKGGSLQAPNFKDVTGNPDPDDQTVIFVTRQPLAIFLDRLENRFILSKVAGDKFVTALRKSDRYWPLQIRQLPARRQYGFYPATTTIGAARQRSKKLSLRKSRKKRRVWRLWSRVKPISVNNIRCMKWRACKNIRACASTRSRVCAMFFRLQHDA